MRSSLFSSEQLLIAETAHKFLVDRFPPGSLLQPFAWCPDDWRAIASLGWLGLGIDETLGGVGLSCLDEVALFFEIGYTSAPGPLLASVIAAHIAELADEPELARAIVRGDVDTALTLPGGRGASHLVLDYSPTAVIVSEAGLLAPSAVREVVPIEAVDASAVLARCQFDPTAHPLAEVDGIDSENIANRLLILAAAVQAGVAAATLDGSVSYAKSRHQFGVPIGTFQAVKHRCADMAVRSEAALQLVAIAARALESKEIGAPAWAAAAKLRADASAAANSADHIRNLGGVGFTWEEGAHLFVGKAQMYSCVGRSPGQNVTTLLNAPSSLRE